MKGYPDYNLWLRSRLYDSGKDWAAARKTYYYEPPDVELAAKRALTAIESSGEYPWWRHHPLTALWLVSFVPAVVLGIAATPDSAAQVPLTVLAVPVLTINFLVGILVVPGWLIHHLLNGGDALRGVRESPATQAFVEGVQNRPLSTHYVPPIRKSDA